MKCLLFEINSLKGLLLFEREMKMEKHIAIIRGINVGGKRKILMADLNYQAWNKYEE